MFRSGYPAKMAPICLLLFFLSLSGCGAIFDILLKNQHDRDDAFCRSQCSGFEDLHDFNHCRQKCMFDQGLERSEMERNRQRERRRKERMETEQSETDKHIIDKVDKGLKNQTKM